MPPRPPELRPYRVAIYAVFGAVAAVLAVQVIRSVVSDVFARDLPQGARRPASAATCLDEVERLFAHLSSRAMQPAPGGFDNDRLALEWDRWVRRWEADVAEVSGRCNFDDAADPARRHLGQAVDGLENLRREISRSGDEASKEARQVRDALTSARAALKMR